MPLALQYPIKQVGTQAPPSGGPESPAQFADKSGRDVTSIFITGRIYPETNLLSGTPDADANARLWNDISFRFGGFVVPPVFQMLDGLDSKFSTDSRAWFENFMVQMGKQQVIETVRPLFSFIQVLVTVQNQNVQPYSVDSLLKTDYWDKRLDTSNRSTASKVRAICSSLRRKICEVLGMDIRTQGEFIDQQLQVGAQIEWFLRRSATNHVLLVFDDSNPVQYIPVDCARPELLTATWQKFLGKWLTERSSQQGGPKLWVCSMKDAVADPHRLTEEMLKQLNRKGQYSLDTGIIKFNEFKKQFADMSHPGVQFVREYPTQNSTLTVLSNGQSENWDARRWINGDEDDDASSTSSFVSVNSDGSDDIGMGAGSQQRGALIDGVFDYEGKRMLKLYGGSNPDLFSRNVIIEYNGQEIVKQSVIGEVYLMLFSRLDIWGYFYKIPIDFDRTSTRPVRFNTSSLHVFKGILKEDSPIQQVKRDQFRSLHDEHTVLFAAMNQNGLGKMARVQSTHDSFNGLDSERTLAIYNVTEPQTSTNPPGTINIALDRDTEPVSMHMFDCFVDKDTRKTMEWVVVSSRILNTKNAVVNVIVGVTDAFKHKYSLPVQCTISSYCFNSHHNVLSMACEDSTVRLWSMVSPNVMGMTHIFSHELNPNGARIQTSVIHTLGELPVTTVSTMGRAQAWEFDPKPWQTRCNLTETAYEYDLGLTKDLQECGDKRDEAQRNEAQCRAANAQWHNKTEEYRSQIDVLQRELQKQKSIYLKESQEHREQIMKLEREAKRADATTRTHQMEIQTLKEKIDKANALEQEIDQAMFELEQQNERLENKNKALKESLGEVREEKRDKVQGLKECQEEVKEKDKELTKLHNTVQGLEDELLRNLNSSAQRERANAKKQEKMFEQALEYQQQLSEAELQNRALDDEVTRLQMQLREQINEWKQRETATLSPRAYEEEQIESLESKPKQTAMELLQSSESYKDLELKAQAAGVNAKYFIRQMHNQFGEELPDLEFVKSNPQFFEKIVSGKDGYQVWEGMKKLWQEYSANKELVDQGFSLGAALPRVSLKRNRLAQNPRLAQVLYNVQTALPLYDWRAGPNRDREGYENILGYLRFAIIMYFHQQFQTIPDDVYFNKLKRKFRQTVDIIQPSWEKGISTHTMETLIILMLMNPKVPATIRKLALLAKTSIVEAAKMGVKNRMLVDGRRDNMSRTQLQRLQTFRKPNTLSQIRPKKFFELQEGIDAFKFAFSATHVPMLPDLEDEETEITEAQWDSIMNMLQMIQTECDRIVNDQTEWNDQVVSVNMEIKERWETVQNEMTEELRERGLLTDAIKDKYNQVITEVLQESMPHDLRELLGIFRDYVTASSIDSPSVVRDTVNRFHDSHAHVASIADSVRAQGLSGSRSSIRKKQRALNRLDRLDGVHPRFVLPEDDDDLPEEENTEHRSALHGILKSQTMGVRPSMYYNRRKPGKLDRFVRERHVQVDSSKRTYNLMLDAQWFDEKKAKTLANLYRSMETLESAYNIADKYTDLQEKMRDVISALTSEILSSSNVLTLHKKYERFLPNALHFPESVTDYWPSYAGNTSDSDSDSSSSSSDSDNSFSSKMSEVENIKPPTEQQLSVLKRLAKINLDALERWHLDQMDASTFEQLLEDNDAAYIELLKASLVETLPHQLQELCRVMLHFMESNDRLSDASLKETIAMWYETQAYLQRVVARQGDYSATPPLTEQQARDKLDKLQMKTTSVYNYDTQRAGDKRELDGGTDRQTRQRMGARVHRPQTVHAHYGSAITLQNSSTASAQ